MAKTLHSNAGGSGSIPGQGTKSHMPQLKTLCAATKTQCSQINKIFKKAHHQSTEDAPSPFKHVCFYYPY